VNQDNINKPENPAAPKPAGGRSRRLKVASAVATVGLIAAAGAGTLNMAQAVNAADPASTSSTSEAAAATTAPGATAPTAGGRIAGGPHETVTDTSVAATAIGIKEADLITALKGGQTLADVAKANNVDVQVVIDALIKDKQDELAAEVKAGTLTQAQADAEAATITQRATDQVNGTFQGGGPGQGGGDRQETVTDTSVIADAIGITEAKLIAALNSGQTPADVAKANNVDVQVVIDALVKDGEQELADQVTAGTLTQAQADAQKATVVTRATDQANGTLNVGGGRHEPDADDQATPSSSPSTNG
jgi:hypothetical protein